MVNQYLRADGGEHQGHSQSGGGYRCVRVGASGVRSLAVRLELSSAGGALIATRRILCGPTSRFEGYAACRLADREIVPF